MRWTAATDTGPVRSLNEDLALGRPDLGLWAVADGMGGHGGGDVASRLAIDHLDQMAPAAGAAELLATTRQRLAAAHEALRGHSRRLGLGRPIGCTIAVLLLHGGHFCGLWAGDTRIYLWRGGHLHQVTHDHTVVQELVDQGAILAADAARHPARNMVTRALGAIDRLALDSRQGVLHTGDRFLICSDGVHGALEAAALAGLMQADDPAAASVGAALAAGSRDNATAIAVMP